MKSLCRIVAALALAAGAPSIASQDVDHYQEPGPTAGREYIRDNFAEHIDPFSGNLSLQFVDLRLPGSAGFDLKVHRSYNANAIGEVYSPFGRGWDIHFGRVRHNTGQACANATGQSMVLEMPDGSAHTLHRSNGVASTSTSDYVTTSFWKAQCTPTGIRIQSPDGTEYDMSEADPSAWHAKRVTDRHGNYFDISYIVNATTGTRVVSQVTASDGRLVTLSYAGGKLTSISGGGNTWAYTVSTAADGSNQMTRVSPPAGGNWDYVYNPDRGLQAGSFLLQRLTNPFGGVLTYSYTFVTFRPEVSVPPVTVVSQKTAGSDTWQYAYSPSCQSGTYDTTTVTQPDGIGQVVYRHFGYCNAGAGLVWKIGLLYQKQQGNEQTETYTWSSQAISNEATTRPGYNNLDTQINRPLLAQKQVSRDGLVHSTTYSSFDAYGNPQSISESGNGSRTRSVTYFNSTAQWIVGLVNNESYSVGSINRARNTVGDVTSESRFGVTTSYTYNGDGSVATRTTAKPATTSFSNYFRGIPRSEARPEGVTISRVVDSAGNITSESDGVSTWGYGYDGIGRITSIDFPTGSDANLSWSTTSRSLTRGGFNETVQFDGFGRITSITRAGIGRTFAHDALGRKTFESLPGSGSGSTYTLDVLGRVTREVSPAGTKTYVYSNGNMTATNERGHATRYDYDRYGDPEEGFLTQIAAPVSSASVDMSRNVVGVLLSATQAGVTRTYGRNGSFFLTSITEPETGTTTFGRDGVGNMISKSLGGQTVTYGYDGLNRLTSISGPSLSATIGYDKRGKVTSVANSAAQRAYTYDANGNLTEDRLTIDGNVFVVGYDYDALDGLASVTYPMSKGVVTYAPDTLGRPTRASPFLNSVSHYASGNLSSISYANGIVQSFGENARQLPSSISATSIQLGLTYAYDGAGNVDSISNSYFGAESRNLGYDSVDRLTSASGPWGAGSITYDGAGNITRQDLGSYILAYNYSANRVASITGSRSMVFQYDGRGNVTGNGSSTFTFDVASQLTCANCGTAGQVDYAYDGQGRRVSEQKNGRKTYFVQAPNGDLQFEYTPIGKNWVKHIYLHGKRVASESDSDALVTTISASASPASPTYGQSVSITASVSPGAATGTVEFMDGTQTLGVAQVAGGQATLAISNLAVGSRTITVNYLGDANYRGSSGSVTVTITKRASSTTLSVSPTSGGFGSTAALAATVGGTNPTGQVEFRHDGQVIGVVALANGAASTNVGPMGAGTHSFTATYLGDGNHNPSTSPTATASIAKGNPNPTVSSSNPTSTMGSTVTFTAVVPTVAGYVPTGTVSFLDGANAIGAATLSGGSASMSTNALTVGTHQITVSYSGDVNFNAANSAAFAQVVQSATSGTTMVMSPVAAYSNQAIAITASVSGSSPTGTVHFQDGGVDVATATLVGGSATAQIRLAPGTHTLRVVYDGDSNNGSSTSASATKVVRAGQRPPADFNGDGRNDIGWFNSANAQVYLVLMNGFAVSSAGNAYNTGTTQSKPVVAGDFNGDGNADVLERNMSTGEVSMVLMNGLTVIGEQAVYYDNDPNWQVFAAADLDGDGKDDIVWYNATAGVVFVQLMDGTTIKASGNAYTVGSGGWVLSAVADFSGDGKTDLVWRHTGSGAVWMVHMNGLSVAAEALIYTEPSMAWQIVAAADFNADGRADLVWFNASTRQVYVQLMDGFTIQGANFVYTAGGTGEWKLVETGDFDGDGKADLLWYNVNTGQVWMVRMDGFSQVADQSVYQEWDLAWGIFNR